MGAATSGLAEAIANLPVFCSIPIGIGLILIGFKISGRIGCIGVLAGVIAILLALNI